MNLLFYLEEIIKAGASDMFIVAGSPIAYRKDSQIIQFDTHRLTSHDTENLITEIYSYTDSFEFDYAVNNEEIMCKASRSINALAKYGDDDFSISIPGVGRFRANTFKQRGSLAAVIRIMHFDIPNPEILMIPPAVMALSKILNGLIIITGPAGSGKTTTLACLIDQINSTKSGHIITMEDPIEYVHTHKKSVVSQREINTDTLSYKNALKAVLRQSPDVILIGEMRDFETIEIATTAAETGQLVFSTLHTTGAANTINRIIDIFPPNQQNQIRVQLSMVLNAVVSQQLIPSFGGSLVPAFEIMLPNTAIRNMIRENKIHQINSAIYAGASCGMVTMDQSIIQLYKKGIISKDTALQYCINLEEMKKQTV